MLYEPFCVPIGSHSRLYHSFHYIIDYIVHDTAMLPYWHEKLKKDTELRKTLNTFYLQNGFYLTNFIYLLKYLR